MDTDQDPQSENSTGNSSQYAISLDDIKHVGPATVDKLSTLGIDSVGDLHLLSGSKKTIKSRAQRKDISISEPAWDSLEAVASTVTYRDEYTVKEKHLSISSLSSDDSHPDSSFIDISVNGSGTAESGQQRLTLTESTHELKVEESLTLPFPEAVEKIRETYGRDEGYPTQLDLQKDIMAFATQSELFDSDDGDIPLSIIMDIVRYDTPASAGKQSMQNRDVLTAEIKRVLRGFAESSQLGDSCK